LWYCLFFFVLFKEKGKKLINLFDQKRITPFI
jgi:hypothetical protein